MTPDTRLVPADALERLRRIAFQHSQRNETGENLRRAAEAVCCAAIPAPALPAAEAVAWQVKDYADGWILYQSEQAARASAEHRNGATVRPLYAHPTPSHSLAGDEGDSRSEHQ